MTCGHEGAGEGGANQESSIDIYMLPRVTHIASGKLLCNIESPSQCSVMTQRGTEGQEEGDMYLQLIHIVVQQKNNTTL